MSKDFDPMVYDVMRELATQLGGRYIAWADAAANERDAQHWVAEDLRVMREARAINPDDVDAVKHHTLHLTEIIAALPEAAPVLA